MERYDKEKIIQLYKLYGFSLVEEATDYLAFTYSNGYFYNAEIVCFVDDISVDDKKDEFEKSGFSVREIRYNSFEEMHQLLFRGFFDVNRINERLKTDYKDFCILQSSKLFEAEYEYIEPSYGWDNELRHDNLIAAIDDKLNQAGAQLIILEAAAGYGKTCTSYELINYMANHSDMQKAPIFTELSKNRKAALFRYVLLDEIDKKFTSLSSKLVISEIQQGRVPLIIDGFDELISRSNKNMSNASITDDDSQTMLDTIADLFSPGSNTKVVLTSRSVRCQARVKKL